MSEPGGRITATNITVFELIRGAYQLQGFQIVGGPDWINRDRFDVLVKVEGNLGLAQLTLMRQTLLADRFHFTTHHDVRQMPAYALMVKQAGKFGPKLRPTQDTCADAGKSPRPDEVRCGISGGPGHLSTRGNSLSEFAHFLSFSTDRAVLDRTGLTGSYELELEWIPDPFQVGNSDAASGPSLFTAVQEQLGLKLQPTKGPVDVLVIDSVEKPTPD